MIRQVMLCAIAVVTAIAHGSTVSLERRDFDLMPRNSISTKSEQARSAGDLIVQLLGQSLALPQQPMTSDSNARGYFYDRENVKLRVTDTRENLQFIETFLADLETPSPMLTAKLNQTTKTAVLRLKGEMMLRDCRIRVTRFSRPVPPQQFNLELVIRTLTSSEDLTLTCTDRVRREDYFISATDVKLSPNGVDGSASIMLEYVPLPKQPTARPPHPDMYFNPDNAVPEVRTPPADPVDFSTTASQAVI